MSKKKLTPEQEKAIMGDTDDLDGNLNEAVGLDTVETFFTNEIVQVNAKDKDICESWLKVIAEYIQNQLAEDCANDQISLKEYIDPFTGSKNQ